jgi:anti-anti-sigma regulatory factor
VTDISIAVSQSSRQGFHGSVAHAAATVLTNLVTDFIGSFATNSLVAVVQSVDQSSHDFRIAAAVVSVAQAIDRFSSVLSIASRL